MSRGDVVCLAGALGLTGAVYFPITRGYFFADDFANLQWIANGAGLRYLLAPYGGHILVVRNAIFWLFYSAFGMRAAPWFWSVWATHLLNVALLFALLRTITGTAPLAGLGAALWGVAPANEGSLAWYAAYGHAVAASLVLLVLTCVARRVREPRPVSASEALGWDAALLAASCSFGVAIGVAVAFPVVVRLLFGPERITRSGRIALLALPVALLFTYVAVHWLSGPAYARGLAYALAGATRQSAVVAAMLVHLLGAGATYALGGVLRASYPGPFAIPVVTAFAAALGAVLLASPPPVRRLVAAFLVTLAGCYAVIAAGRGPFFATFSHAPVYGAGTPRYHYLPGAFVVTLLCLVLGRACDLAPRRACAAWVAFGVGVFTIAVVHHHLSNGTIDTHAASRAATDGLASRLRADVESAPPGADVYLQNGPFGPALLQAQFAGYAGVFLIFYPDGLGRRVHFVESRAFVRDAVPSDTRLFGMLVAPEEVPAGATVVDPLRVRR